MLAGIVTAGGLDFRLATGDFSVSGSVNQSKQPVQVGFHTNATFVPILMLHGTTEINIDTVTLKTTGELDAISGTSQIPLLSNGISLTTISTLIGSGLPGLTGQSFTAAGVAFTLNSLALSNSPSPHVQLQGNLALPGNLNLAVNGPNYVNIGSSGVSLTGITASQSGSFTQGGVAFSGTYTVGYTTPSDVFTITGNSTATIGGIANLNVNLGGDSTSGLVITNGSLTSVNASVTGNFTVGGVKVTASGLKLTDTIDIFGGSTFNLTGGATASVTGLGDLGVTFGNTTNGVTYPGLVLTNGNLTNLDMTVNSNITVGSVTFTTNNLRMTYSKPVADTLFTMTGGASFSQSSLGTSAINVLFGGTSTGLVITNGSLTSLDMTVNSDITVGSLKFTTNNLKMTYSKSGTDTLFTMTGGASFSQSSLGTSAINVLFGQAATMTSPATTGLVIKNGSLTSLDVTLNSNITVSKVNIKTTGLRFVYDGVSTFKIPGSSSGTPSSITATVAGMGEFSVLFGYSIGSTTPTDGLVVTNGNLVSLDMTVNASVNLKSVSINLTGVRFQYSFDNFTMSGTASAHFNSGLGDLSLTLGHNIKDINGNPTNVTTPGIKIFNGNLETFDATVNANFQISGITFNVNDLEFLYQNTSQLMGSVPGAYTGPGVWTGDYDTNKSYSESNYFFAMSGKVGAAVGGIKSTAGSANNSLSLMLGHTTTVGGVSTTTPGIYIVNGNLQTFDATVNANFKVGGVTITATDLEFKYESTNSVFTMNGTLGATIGGMTSNSEGTPSLSLTLGHTDSTTNVTTPGIKIVRGNLETFDATVQANFNVGAVALSVTDLEFLYQNTSQTTNYSGAGVYHGDYSNDPSTYNDSQYVFTMSGTLAATIGGINSVSLRLGDTASNPGVKIVDGNLESIDALVNASLQFGVVTFGVNNLRFLYQNTSQIPTGASVSWKSVYVGTYSANPAITTGTNAYKAYDATLYDFTMSGDLSASVIGIGSIGLTLGYTDATGAQVPGVLIVNGKLEYVDATVKANFSVGTAASFKINDLRFFYQNTSQLTIASNPLQPIADSTKYNSTGYNSTSYVFSMSGGAKLSVFNFVDASVAFGDSTHPGLVVTNGTLTSLYMTINASVGVNSVNFASTSMLMTYLGSTDTFTMTGNTSFSIPGLASVNVHLGGSEYGASTAGLVITHGNLVTMDMTVTSNMGVSGVDFAPSFDTKLVMKAQGGTFVISGGASLNMPGIGSASVTLGGTPSNQSFTIYPLDRQFLQPTQANGAYVYRPTNSSWTFQGEAGVGTVGGGFNVPTPPSSGSNSAAFLQRLGVMYQSLYLPAGTYTVSFQTALRAGNLNHDFGVWIDTTNIQNFIPNHTYFETRTTYEFTVTAGIHTIKFVGINGNGGDNTSFIADVRFNGTAPAVGTIYPGDRGFSQNALSGGGLSYLPSSSPWTFTGNTGVAGNNSGFNNGTAPEGSQVAFIQGSDSISQNVTFPTTTTYTFKASYKSRPDTAQGFSLLIDDNPVANFDTYTANYKDVTFSLGPITAGDHKITLKGRTAGSGATCFVDKVSISFNGNASFVTIADSGFETTGFHGTSTFQYRPNATPWKFVANSGIISDGSAFQNVKAADADTQAAFIQSDSSFYQDVYLPAGTFTINFSAARRTGSNPDPTVGVSIDNIIVGQARPSLTDYTSYVTNAQTLTAGTHRIQFQGVLTAANQADFFIDNISITYPLQVTQNATGLVITDGKITSLNASVSANFAFGPFASFTGNLNMSYTAAANSFTMSGNANVNILGTLGVDILLGGGNALGGANSPGLVITNGSVKSLDFSISSVNSFRGIFTANLTTSVHYNAGSGELDLSGTASVRFLSTGNWYNTFLPSGNLGECGFYLKVLKGDNAGSYFDIYGTFSGETVGIKVDFNGNITILAGDPLSNLVQTIVRDASLAYENTAAAFANAYIKASNGTVGVYNVVTSQLTSAYNAAGNAANDAANAIGRAIDAIRSLFGPLSGATVYYDPNNDFDYAHDAFAITSANGSLDISLLNIPAGATKGQIIVVGGIDISTGLPNLGVLTAPLGSLTVTPFTTIINEIMRKTGVSLGTAVLRLRSVLGIPSSIDLLNNDYIKQGLAGDPVAARVYGIEVMLSSMANGVDRMLIAARGGTPLSVGTKFFEGIATYINNTGGAPIDFTDPVALQSLIIRVANYFGVTLNNIIVNGHSVAEGVAEIMSRIHAYVDQLDGAGTADYMNKVLQAHVLSAKTLAPKLEQVATGTLSISDLVASFDGPALIARIQAAVIGTLNVDPPTIGIANLVEQPVGYGDVSTFQIPVYLTTQIPHLLPIRVDYTTGDLTAASDDGDYTPVSGTLTWLAGDAAPKFITVAVQPTSTIAAHKQFRVKLSNPVNATLTTTTGIGDIAYTDFATSVTLTSSKSPSDDGVTLKAAIQSANARLGTEESYVTFFDGVNSLGTIPVIQGVATLVVKDLGVSPHSITAKYQGYQELGANYQTSTSDAVDVTDYSIPLKAEFTTVTPNPRNTSVGSVTVNFLRKVTGLDASDFELTRNGAKVSLDGFALTRLTDFQYVCDLSMFTAASGDYVLKLLSTGSGIADAAGNPLVADAMEEFLVHPWQNVKQVFDVDGDTYVSPHDVLLIINAINRQGIGAITLPPANAPFVDVNGDGSLSPIDVLMVINFINSGSARGSNGEGESKSIAPFSELPLIQNPRAGGTTPSNLELHFGFQPGPSMPLQMERTLTVATVSSGIGERPFKSDAITQRVLHESPVMAGQDGRRPASSKLDTRVRCNVVSEAFPDWSETRQLDQLLTVLAQDQAVRVNSGLHR